MNEKKKHGMQNTQSWLSGIGTSLLLKDFQWSLVIRDESFDFFLEPHTHKQK